MSTITFTIKGIGILAWIIILLYRIYPQYRIKTIEGTKLNSTHILKLTFFFCIPAAIILIENIESIPQWWNFGVIPIITLAIISLEDIHSDYANKFYSMQALDISEDTVRKIGIIEKVKFDDYTIDWKGLLQWCKSYNGGCFLYKEINSSVYSYTYNLNFKPDDNRYELKTTKTPTGAKCDLDEIETLNCKNSNELISIQTDFIGWMSLWPITQKAYNELKDPESGLNETNINSTHIDRLTSPEKDTYWYIGDVFLHKNYRFTFHTAYIIYSTLKSWNKKFRINNRSAYFIATAASNNGITLLQRAKFKPTTEDKFGTTYCLEIGNKDSFIKYQKYLYKRIFAIRFHEIIHKTYPPYIRKLIHRLFHLTHPKLTSKNQ